MLFLVFSFVCNKYSVETVKKIVRLGLDKKIEETQTESETGFERIGKCDFF